MTWVMLIISIATGEVKARIPYQSLSDCQLDAIYAIVGNYPGTVRVTCEKVAGSWLVTQFALSDDVRRELRKAIRALAEPNSPTEYDR